MGGKSRSKETPCGKPTVRAASCHRRMSTGAHDGSIRQLDAVKKARLGMTLRPAKRAKPSSKTALLTGRWRALPKRFKAKRARMAWAAGILFALGKPNACRPRHA